MEGWPWFKFHAERWLTEITIAGLTHEERGHFFDLVMRSWALDGAVLPDNDVTLAHAAGYFDTDGLEAWGRLREKLVAGSILVVGDQAVYVRELRNAFAAMCVRRKVRRRAAKVRWAAQPKNPSKVESLHAHALQMPTHALRLHRRREEKIREEKIREEEEIKEEEKEEIAARTTRAAGGTRLAEFELTATRRAYAETKGIPPGEVADELEEFCDYWRSVPGARGRKLDWDATWRTRCRARGLFWRRRLELDGGRRTRVQALDDSLAYSRQKYDEAVEEERQNAQDTSARAGGTARPGLLGSALEPRPARPVRR